MHILLEMPTFGSRGNEQNEPRREIMYSNARYNGERKRLPRHSLGKALIQHKPI